MDGVVQILTKELGAIPFQYKCEICLSAPQAAQKKKKITNYLLGRYILTEHTSLELKAHCSPFFPKN